MNDNDIETLIDVDRLREWAVENTMKINAGTVQVKLIAS